MDMTPEIPLGSIAEDKRTGDIMAKAPKSAFIKVAVWKPYNFVQKGIYFEEDEFEKNKDFEIVKYGELKQSPRETLERTWDAAVAITHWEERNAEWSKCTLPDKETFINSILGESPKEEAVEFAEWLLKNTTSHSLDKRKHITTDEDIRTTTELYNLFKQSSDKGSKPTSEGSPL